MFCCASLLCCLMRLYAFLCYAESNDHWSLRVCPIPNLNLIPVVRWRRCPALVMTLDWLLWAAHTISIGAVPALCSIFIHDEREVGPSRVLHERRGAGLHMRLSSSPLAQSACAPTNSTARKGSGEALISKPQLLPGSLRFPLLSLWHSPNFMLPPGNVCCPTPFAFRLRPGSISHGYEAQSGFI